MYGSPAPGAPAPLGSSHRHQQGEPMSVRARLVGVVVAAATVLGLAPGLVGPAAGAEDHDAPVLTAVAVTPGPLHPGDPYTFSWQVAEQDHLSRLLLRFDNEAPDAYGHFLLLTSTQ